MNKLFRIKLLIFCFFISVNFLFAQKIKPKTVPQTKVDLGNLSQNTYTNGFFEVKIEFPFGWLVGDNLLESQLMAIQKMSVQAKSIKDQKSINQAMNRVTPLLGGYRFLPGSVAENSNLRIIAENLTTTPKIKTSQDYLASMIYSLKLIKLPPDYSISAVKNEVIGGKTVDYVEIKYQNSQKRSYVIVKKGFALVLTIDSYNDKDFDELHKILKEANLDYKK